MYKLLRIDELLRPDHPYLTSDDDCFYFMEYFPRNYDDAHNLIMNFKKKMDRSHLGDFKYKVQAINKIAGILRASLREFEKPNVILVPIPPSKPKGHPLYDDRILQVLKIFCHERKNADLREIISISKAIGASHDSESRPTVEELLSNLVVDKDLCKNPKEKIVLVDDTLVAGAHFKACKTLLQQYFPDAKINGLFLARRNLS